MKKKKISSKVIGWEGFAKNIYLFGIISLIFWGDLEKVVD